MSRKATILVGFGLVLLNISNAQAQVKFSHDVLSHPAEYRALFEKSIPITEIELYSHQNENQVVLLENGYADYTFENPDVWPPQSEAVIPTEVTIIFTKYPKDKEFWLTDYHWLLAKRLEALFKLDSGFNDRDVSYNILLQTSCDNEFEAMQLFHGIRVKYDVLQDTAHAKQELEARPEASIEDERLGESESGSTNSKNSIYTKRILRFMAQEQHYMDSSVYKALNRNLAWRNAVLVLDWTGSMYGFGAEAILWHALNIETSGIDEVIFFNDGDRKRKRRKSVGNTGGIYHSTARPVTKPMRMFSKVKNRGDGGDSPENDIEAIGSALREFPESDEIILIADNGSCMRDYVLHGCITKPVRIILCDAERGINHQYLNLAWKTGGSIHTENLDLYDIHDLVSKDSLIINGMHYTLTPEGIIMPTDRFGNNFGYCDRYYKYNPRNKRKRRRNEPKCYFTR